MPATTIQNVLDSENLTGLTREVIGGLPDDLLPSGFLTSTESVSGNTAKYDKVSSTRKSALIVQYGSPSAKVNLKGISEQPVRLIHTFQHQVHDASTLVNLREEGDAGKQMKGQQTVARQVASFGNQFSNLRTAAIHSLLSKGAIFVAADGSLLASSSGAAYTIDFGIPAGNKGTLGVDGGEAILNANWDTAATDIGLQVQNLRAAARKFTGYPLRHVFYGPNIPTYIRGNTMAQTAISGSVRLSEAQYANEIPDGLFGMTWHAVDQAFFELADGTATDWYDDDAVVFTPDPTPDWIDTIQGSFLVPTELGISQDASAVLNSLNEMFGPFGYAELTTDPPGIKQYGGDTFLPVLKVPNAMFIGVAPTS